MRKLLIGASAVVLLSATPLEAQWRSRTFGDTVRVALLDADSHTLMEAPELSVLCDRGARPVPRFGVQLDLRSSDELSWADVIRYHLERLLNGVPRVVESDPKTGQLIEGAPARRLAAWVEFGSSNLIQGEDALRFLADIASLDSVTFEREDADEEFTFRLTGMKEAIEPIMDFCGVSLDDVDLEPPPARQ